jgi:hypothetical protein
MAPDFTVSSCCGLNLQQMSQKCVRDGASNVCLTERDGSEQIEVVQSSEKGYLCTKNFHLRERMLISFFCFNI